MAGIYIHIPFCKQACYYCDFHFSTSLKNKSDLLLALAKELAIRKNEFNNQVVETIYFGGGTPSILDSDEINMLIQEVYKYYSVVENPEITLEANPDDLSEEKIIELANSPINRLSIGVQSFFQEDLISMNRAHSALEATKCLEIAVKYFKNISVDLIYGIPNMSNQKWQQNIQILLDFNIPHISSYALTVEPKTALHKFIEQGTFSALDDGAAREHFLLLLDILEVNDYIQYEFSNFGKKNYFSKNNSSYWQGKKYIGIGPSAHSYDGKSRSWNVSNNSKYIKGVLSNNLEMETEILSLTDMYNEYVMTGLRTIWGISVAKIESNFGLIFKNYFFKNAEKYLKNGTLQQINDTITVTKNGKFLSDGIASDLFYVNLNK
jgi:oxygen-independent coproporphyrinogen-3 oxidase